MATDNSYSANEEATSVTGNVITDNTGAGSDTDDQSSKLLLLDVNGNPALVGTTLTLASGAQIVVNDDGSFQYDLNNQFQHLALGESVNDAVSYRVADGWDVRMVRVNGNSIDNTTEAESIVAAATGLGPLTIGSNNYTVEAFAEEAIGVIDYGDGGGNDDYNINNALPDGSIDGGDDFVVQANSYWTIPIGTYTVAFGSDDGGLIRLANGITFDNVFNSDTPSGSNEIRRELPRSHAVTGGSFTVSQPTSLELSSLMFDRNVNASFEISIAAATQTSFNSNTFQLLKDGALGWQAASDTASLTLSVAGVNDAPVLNATPGFALTAIDDNETNPVGDTVADLLSSVFGTPISDVDSSDPDGIAIIDASSSTGSWQFSTNNGINWTSASSASASNAVTLDPTAKLRFVPIAGQQGSATLLFRAWDQSNFSNGQAGVDATTTGGTTPFSDASAVATIVVNDTADAPLLSNDSYSVASNNILTVGPNGLLQNDFDANSPVATSGATLSYNARLDTNGNGAWENQVSGGLDWVLSSGVNRVANPITDRPGIHATYNFANAGGSAASFETLPGDPTNNAASFEIWFRPVSDSDRDVLFETGGSADGTSISLDGNTLKFVIRDTDGSVAETELTATIDPNEYSQVVGVIDIGPGDMRLYLNGNLVASATNSSLNDWAGGDGAGLGKANGATNFSGATSFEGEIAWFRFYESALSTTQVATNYESIASGLKILSVSTPTGGQVAVQLDGSFVFDPNGDFDALAVTDIGSSTFTYTAQDGNGTTAVATVSVVVQGVNDPPVTAIDAYNVLAGDELEIADISAGVLGDDLDPEGNTPAAGTLTATVTTAPTKGALTLNADGTFTYTPNVGEVGVDEFYYIADYGVEQSQPTRVELTITGGAVSGGDEPAGDESGGEGETGGEEAEEVADESDGEDSTPTNEQPPLVAPPSNGSLDGRGQQLLDRVSSLDVAGPQNANSDDADQSGLAIQGLSVTSGSGVRETRDRLRTLAEEVVTGAIQSSPLTAGVTQLAAPIDLAFVSQSGAFWRDLEDFEESIEQDIRFEAAEVASALGVTTTLSVGYVLWFLRGTYLVSCVLAQMPAWKMVDPLFVFGGGDLLGDEDDESLTAMLQRSNEGDLTAPDGDDADAIQGEQPAGDE